MQVFVSLVQIVHVQADRTDVAVALVATGMIVDMAAHRAFDLVAAIRRPGRMLLRMRMLRHKNVLTPKNYLHDNYITFLIPQSWVRAYTRPLVPAPSRYALF